MMEEANTTHKDVHGTTDMTGWVHHHRRMAKWLMRLMVAGVTAFLYYLRKEEKHIEEEQRKG